MKQKGDLIILWGVYKRFFLVKLTELCNCASLVRVPFKPESSNSDVMPIICGKVNAH